MLKKRFERSSNTVEAFEMRKACGCDPLCNCGCQPSSGNSSSLNTTTKNKDYYAYSKVYAR